jgi:hypothetical protein
VTRVKGILRESLEEQKKADTTEAETDRLRREVQGAERKVRNHSAALGEAAPTKKKR